jgi:hypothetical protein
MTCPEEKETKMLASNKFSLRKNFSNEKGNTFSRRRGLNWLRGQFFLRRRGLSCPKEQLHRMNKEIFLRTKGDFPQGERNKMVAPTMFL